MYKKVLVSLLILGLLLVFIPTHLVLAASWTSPTGYDDPSSAWTDEPNAYDDDEGSWTRGGAVDSYLELTHSSIVCSKIRIYAEGFQSPTHYNPDIDIDVYYGDGWHNIWSGVVQQDEWVEKSIGSVQLVTKARIKNNSSSYDLYIYEFDFYQLYPPTVVTNAATSVEEVTATLNGQVTGTDGLTVTRRGFQWDTDSGSPYASDWYEDGSFGTGSFSHGITGLEEGTLYYFRAYAVTVAGTGYGSEKKFLLKPLVPTSFSASVNGTSIDLSWTKGTGADKTLIRYKVGSYPTSKTDGTQIYFNSGTSYIHESLGGGSYYYRAWSYVTDGGLEQYSDNYAQDNAYTETGLALYFEPNTIVIGTTLIDRSGNGRHGTITWGSNPSGIEVSIGGLEPFSSYTAVEIEEGEIPEVLPTPGTITPHTEAGVTGEGLPLQANFQRAADSLDWSLPVTYTIMFVIVAIVVGVAGLAAAGTTWGFAIGFGSTSAFFGTIRDSGGYLVMPIWITIVCVLFAILVGYIWRYS